MTVLVLAVCKLQYNSKKSYTAPALYYVHELSKRLIPRAACIQEFIQNGFWSVCEISYALFQKTKFKRSVAENAHLNLCLSPGTRSSTCPFPPTFNFLWSLEFAWILQFALLMVKTKNNSEFVDFECQILDFLAICEFSE